MSNNSIPLSQDELDKVLNGSTIKSSKNKSPDTEAKINLIKQKAKSVAEKIQNDDEKKVNPKKSSSQKASSKKALCQKKSSEKLSVYFEGKLFGSAIISTKNGKKIIELLSIRKNKSSPEKLK